MAFRASADEWLRFTARLEHLVLEDGAPAPQIVDHKEAWSVYFSEPYGHRLEVTAYEADAVREARIAAL